MGGRLRAAVLVVAMAGLGLAFLSPVAPASAAPKGGPAAYWTKARIASATPRDLVIDGRGKGYQKHADGSLTGYGQSDSQLYAMPAKASKPAKPVPEKGRPQPDTSGPTVTNRVPVSGATVGTTTTFSATVSDPSGVRSVDVVITFPSGSTQTFATSASGNTWSITLTGFSDGAWQWRMVAKDNVGTSGNTTTTSNLPFTVSTSGGGSTGDVTNAQWTGGGAVQNAAARLYFEMPNNARATTWTAYVCSGSVARDATSGRSIILTAAHCVYDDEHKAFARNVLFIPNQSGTTGAGTDTDCTNDPMGCWVPSFGVVDTNWTTRVFPANTAWDYAFYVVNDTGAHKGTGADAALDGTAGDLAVQLTAPTNGATAQAMGYSYSEDPNFMYCSENLTLESGGDWWLGHCGLSGGASGGPWLQPASGGNGPIISVNSWGYTNQPGMAGPRLDISSASCVFSTAKSHSFNVSNRGVAATC